LPRAAKLTTKGNAVKPSAKGLGTLKTLSARKAKPTARQTKQVKVKKSAPTTSTKTIKTSAQKTKPISPAKKVETAEKKIKNTTAARKAKSKITTAKPKVSIKSTVKSSIKSAKSQSSKAVVQAVKPRQSKVKIAAPSAKFRPAKIAMATKTKIKSVSQKAKPVAAPNNPKIIGRTKPTGAAKPVKRMKTTTEIPAKKVNRHSKKIQPVISARKIVKITEKIKPIVAAPKFVKKTIKVKPAVTAKKAGGKIQKLKLILPAAPVKKLDSKIEKATLGRKVKPVENVIEATQARPLKPKNRKAKPICSAVFRGKKERYDFKVFALNEIFEPIPAVYIISKRKTDKRKKGHHALICIGETASVSDELKRHRKGKCVKKHEANVVSILPEADAKVRLKIETDLKAAHTVACNLD